MFFIGSPQWLSPPHYRSQPEAHLVTLWGTTQERSLIFPANPDSVIGLTPGPAATTSLLGIMTMAASVVAVSIATTVSAPATVSSPISDSSGLATLMIGIPGTSTTDTRSTTDILTIILIMTSGRF